MAAVGDIERLAVGQAEDLRGGGALGVGAGGQSRQDLELLHRAGGRVDREHAHGHRHLVAHVRETALRVEGEVAGAGARGHATGLGRGRLERAGGRVERVDEDVVGPEVGHGDETVRGVRIDTVGMGAGLATLVRARALVLQEGARGADRTIGLERQAGDGARAVVGREEELARPVQRDVGGALPFRFLRVEQGGRAVRGETVGGDAATGDLGGGVEHLAILA